MRMTLWEYLTDRMLFNTGQQVCEGDAAMTYGEIMDFAGRFAGELDGFGCCAVICRSEMAAGMALLGCFAAGVTAVPLSVRYGEIHCRKMLEAIKPEAVITDAYGGLRVIAVSGTMFAAPAVHPALIMCTSGTSSTPKGVMLTEENIMTNVSDIAGYFAVGSGDSILIARPLYHCAVLTGEFLTGLVKGVKIRFYSGEFNPAAVLKMLRDHEITAFCGTPTLLSMMARFRRGGGEYRLKHICISGECMSEGAGRAVAEAFPDADIYHVYGLTEACPRVSYLPPRLFCRYPDCVGIPLRSVSVRVLDSGGKPVPVGEPGMLWVSGGNVMAGYYNDPGRTAEVLADGWLCTGDIALINDAGLLKIMGRSDDLIIKAGMNIFPREIEDALKADPRVRDVFAYGYGGTFGVQIGLDIAGDFGDVSEVRELCRRRLPAYQMPAEIVLADGLAKSCSGKILRTGGLSGKGSERGDVGSE